MKRQIVKEVDLVKTIKPGSFQKGLLIILLSLIMKAFQNKFISSHFNCRSSVRAIKIP